MDDILARLRVGLDRDEALALAASPGPWHANAERDEVWAVDDIEVCTGFALSNNQLRNTVDFIVEFDPPRVARQIQAHRQILARHHPVRALPSYVPGAPMPGDMVCAGCGSKGNGRGETLWPCPDVQDLASIYNVEVGNGDR